MSYRGSFCTNYIYCSDEQFEKIKQVFEEKTNRVVAVGTCILAGFIKSGWLCGEANEFEWYVIPKLQKVLKDDLYIIVSVMCESDLVCVYKITKDDYKEIASTPEEE